MRPEDWERMPWYARKRYLDRRRREIKAGPPAEETASPAPASPVMQIPRITRYRGVWTVYDGVCTAKFGSETAARWFIRQLEHRRT